MTVRQSINKRQKRRAKQSTKLAIDFQDNRFCMILSAFSEAYLPACMATESLVNLPRRKAGIIYLLFNFAIPAAKNSGVVGRGNKE